MHVLTPIISIELSRRCNLECVHCMRGESQNSTITRELLDKFFDEVKSANMLVISGVEPFMCYDDIKALIETIKSKHVLVSKVLIVTNGTIYDERIYKLLESNFEQIEINISADDYHLDSIIRRYSSKTKSNNPRLHPINLDEVFDNIELHKNSPYFKSIYGLTKYLIDTGRAVNLDVPKKSFDALGYFYTDINEKFIIAGPQIYLDAEGYITDGNSEYASRDKISIGNIKENSVSEMLIKNAIRIECFSVGDFLKFLDNREFDYSKYSGKKYSYVDNKIVEEESKDYKIRW